MSLGKKNILVSYLERQISENEKENDIDCLSEFKKVLILRLVVTSTSY